LTVGELACELLYASCDQHAVYQSLGSGIPRV
jgi:hypothetical protein